MQIEFLEPTNAKLSNLNIRSELHGEAHVTAADLNLLFKQSNSILAYFHPSLKSALYEKSDEAQAELLDDPAHLTKLRFPKIKNAIKWDWDGIGYTVTVHIGVSEKENVVLADCKVVKPVLTPQDGGTVLLGLQIQCRPQPGQLGKLSELLASDISISLKAPDAEAVSTGDKPLFDQSPSSAAGEQSPGESQGADKVWPFPKGNRPTEADQLAQVESALRGDEAA